MTMAKHIDINSRTQVTVVQAQMCISSTTGNLSASQFQATLSPIFRYGYEFKIYEDGQWACTNVLGGSENYMSPVTWKYYYPSFRLEKVKPPGEEKERQLKDYKYSAGAWSELKRLPQSLPFGAWNPGVFTPFDAIDASKVPPTTLSLAYDSEKRVLGILIPALGATLPARGGMKEEFEPGGPTLRWVYLVRHTPSNKLMLYGYITLDYEAIWAADAASVRFDVCSVSTGGPGGGGGEFSFDPGTTAPQVWGVS